MRVIVKRAFRNFSIGQVIPEMPGGQARDLIARGLVEVEPAPEGKGLFAPVDRMLRKGRIVNKAAAS